MNPPPAAIGTNVVVSGLLTADPEAPTARILEGMLDGRFSCLLSIELLAEYREVLLRPRIRKAHRLSDSEIDVLLTAIAVNAIVVEPSDSPEAAPDRGDRHSAATKPPDHIFDAESVAGFEGTLARIELAAPAAFAARRAASGSAWTAASIWLSPLRRKG